MELLSKYGALLLQIAGVLAFVIGGFFAFLNIFDTNRRRRQDDVNTIDARVITGFKQELELQSGVIARMEGDLRELRDNNLKLTGENKTLRDILQGRDEASLKYQAEGRVAMAQIKGLYDSQDSVNKNLDILIMAINKFVTKETEVETHTTITTHPKQATA